MRVQIDHHSTKEVAKERISSKVTELVNGFGTRLSNISHSWSGDTMNVAFTAFHMDIRGQVEVTDSQVIVDVGLPTQARLFEGQARQALQGKLGEFFPE